MTASPSEKADDVSALRFSLWFRLWQVHNSSSQPSAPHLEITAPHVHSQQAAGSPNFRGHCLR